MFNDIYGEHYSKASISRMLDYLRKDVQEWLNRSLEAYYPVLFPGVKERKELMGDSEEN